MVVFGFFFFFLPSPFADDFINMKKPKKKTRKAGWSPNTGQVQSQSKEPVKYKTGYLIQQTLISKRYCCLQGDSFWVIESRTVWNKFNKTRRAFCF